MTDIERRYIQAKHHVQAQLLNPITELLGCAEDAVQEARRDARQAREHLEQMTPVWAHDDQGAVRIALSELWQLLGVISQTAAVTRLQALLAAGELPVVGDLDFPAPNQFDSSKRGFDPK